MNPLCNLIHYLIADHRISRAKHIRANTKCHCRRHSEKSCCDRECSENVKCSLPCISCGISNSDSTNHSDIQIHGSRKYQIQYNKEQTSYNIEQPSALEAQSSVNGRHTDMQAIPARSHHIPEKELYFIWSDPDIPKL